MILEVLFHVFVGITLILMLIGGIGGIYKCIDMRHEKPGEFNRRREDIWREIFKEGFHYSDERIEAEIQIKRNETVNENPYNLLKYQREHIAERLSFFLGGVSLLCLFLGFVMFWEILIAIGFVGVFICFIIGWTIVSTAVRFCAFWAMRFV